MAEKKKTSIGGQALLEGIMMRGPQRTAMAVRNPQGEIVLEEFPTPVSYTHLQPGHRVTQIIQICFVAHLGKAPPVVGMEQNQVRLDAHVRQLANALFQPPPGFRIEPGEVEGVALAGSAPFKGIALRVVVVEFVMLGENAHADFVEISLFQGVQGGLLQCLRLMGPAIAGGAHAHVIFPVGVFQPGGGHVGVHLAGVRAVSYTHLDVYKRQLSNMRQGILK